MMSFFSRKIIAVFQIVVLLFSFFPYVGLGTQKAYAANTTGTGHIATGGYGKYRGAIYWLDWGKPHGGVLENGDKSVFTTPNGLTYTLTVSDINLVKNINGTLKGCTENYKTLQTSKSNDWFGNNFLYAYSFVDEPAISLRSCGAEMSVTITLDVVDANGKHSDYGNIVIAGTESLARSPHESYSMEINTDGMKTPSLNIIETYVNNDKSKKCGENCNAYNRSGVPAGSSWKDALAVKAIVNSTATTKKMTINHISN